MKSIYDIPLKWKNPPASFIASRTVKLNDKKKTFLTNSVLAIAGYAAINIVSVLFLALVGAFGSTKGFDAIVAVNILSGPLLFLIPLLYLRDRLMIGVFDSKAERMNRKYLDSISQDHLGILQHKRMKSIRQNYHRFLLLAIMVMSPSFIIQYYIGARSLEEYWPSMGIFAVTTIVVASYIGLEQFSSITETIRDNTHQNKQKERRALNRIRTAIKRFDLLEASSYVAILMVWGLIYVLAVNLVGSNMPAEFQTSWLDMPLAKFDYVMMLFGTAALVSSAALGLIIGVAYYFPSLRLFGYLKQLRNIIVFGAGLPLSLFLLDPLSNLLSKDVHPLLVGASIYIGSTLVSMGIERAVRKIIK